MVVSIGSRGSHIPAMTPRRKRLGVIAGMWDPLDPIETTMTLIAVNISLLLLSSVIGTENFSALCYAFISHCNLLHFMITTKNKIFRASYIKQLNFFLKLTNLFMLFHIPIIAIMKLTNKICCLGDFTKLFLLFQISNIADIPLVNKIFCVVHFIDGIYKNKMQCLTSWN